MTGIPNYIKDGLDRQDVETLERIMTYCQELIEEQNRAPDIDEDGDEAEEILDKEKKSGYTEVIKKIPCGKNCSGCPHGPYRYHVRRMGGKLDWEYKGKVD
ncbi:MAG: hypothetical protein ABEK59_10695 [Halobacteria archaeon]